jgi:signal transduction histidine kinase
LQPLAESQGVRLEALVAPSMPTIQADGRRLMRALENLVRNAAHYGRSKVEVVAQCANGVLKLEVRDDGPGLPLVDGKPILGISEHQPRRADSAGLGLVVTRRVAEAHGGTLQGANRAGGGASVWIELPLSRSIESNDRSHT